MQRQLFPFRQVVERWVECRLVAGEVVVHAAEPGVVQRSHQGWLEAVDHAHQHLRFGKRLVEIVLLVEIREGPLDLLVTGRPVEVSRVVADGERSAKPSLVEPRAVRIDAVDQVPGEALAIAQLGIIAQHPGEVMHHHRANRLIGVRTGEEQDVLLPGAERKHPDRIAQFRRAHPLEGRDIGILAGQPLEILIHLVNRQEPVNLRNRIHVLPDIQAQTPFDGH